MTPYSQHQSTGHKTTQHSPNGIDVIEECTECTARFVHNPCIGYPVTMPPCPHPPAALYSWVAYDKTLVVCCKQCGQVIRGAS